MARDYNHKAIEQKWRNEWETLGIDKTGDDPNKKKYYVLDMFPYPSGAGLHVGHPKGYIATDIQARRRRMDGFNVLHPMGWDAFGLPAEGYAIKTGTPPQETTDKSIANFKNQISNLALSYDWSREIGTHTPEYYRWTQWLFLKFFEKGLAYKKKALVNWDPVDQTVLANEQVLPDGTGERSGAKVEKKELEQWFFKITDYADELVSGLDAVDWPESTKINQRNWIGRSEGAEIDFTIAGSDQKIKVFTTRPDTLFGATYVVLAPEHPLIQSLVIENTEEVMAYVTVARAKADIERTAEGKEKTGVQIKGVMAVNPATKEEIPLFIADYVLAHYGTGAVMGVPAHDERDMAFAKKYDCAVTQVVKPIYKDTVNPPREGMPVTNRTGVIILIKHWSEDKYLLNSSDKYNWKILFTGGVEEREDPLEAAKREVLEETGYKNIKKAEVIPFKHFENFFRLHKGDNAFVDQTNVYIELADEEQVERFESEAALHQLSWKTKEEMIKEFSHANHKFIFEFFVNNGIANDWSGVLINSGQFDGMDNEEAKKKIVEFVGGKMKTTYKLRDWLLSRQRYWGAPIPIVYDPEGKPHPIPEEHLPWLLPTDVEYLPKGTSPLGSSKELLERTEKIFGKGWRPEIDTMDTFVCSSWYFFRFTDAHNAQEFASSDALKKWMPVDLYVGGAEHTVLHLMYARFFTKALRDMGYLTIDEPFMKLRHVGLVLAEDGRKMSKRWGNVINPDDVVNQFGADSMRTYEMFMGPFEQQVAWNTNGVVGVRRFIERVYRLLDKVGTGDGELDVITNQTIKKVSEDIDAFKFNTAVSQMMIWSNEAEKSGSLSRAEYESFLKLLAPFAPHITDELWHELGNFTSIHQEAWPTYDTSKLVADHITMAVQVGGKLKGTLLVPRGLAQDAIIELVRKDQKMAQNIPISPSRVIFVPDKIINLIP